MVSTVFVLFRLPSLVVLSVQGPMLWALDQVADAQQMYTAMASADLIIDIIVIVLPMPILWTLQLKTSKKILLTAIFGLGFM